MYADPDRLRQILLNLLANAVKFTTTGGVGLFLSVPRPRHLCFAVTDTGPGISEQELPNLFRPFHQVPQDPPTAAPAWGWPCAASSPNSWAAPSTCRAGPEAADLR